MTDRGTRVPNTADEDLAERIVRAIEATKLVSGEKLPKVKEGLCSGNLTSTDWKLLIELADPAETKGGSK
jgi:hypothetical protein